MISQPYHLYIERRDASRNMARFYALSIEPTLFGQVRFVRRWGRIGTVGRTLQHSFDDEGDAVDLFLAVLRNRRQRGYRPGAMFDPTREQQMFGSVDNAGPTTISLQNGRGSGQQAEGLFGSA